MSQLTAHNLRKSYRGRAAVADVSLQVAPGEIVGLLGPNGAGKTTCFYMIVGLVAPDSGHVAIDGVDITQAGMPQRARLGLGYLPQEASVFRKLSVQDNLRAILETRRDLDPDARRVRLERLLNDLHIAHLRSSPGAALSGGERRRVEIARALVIEPRFMLLDEPFAGVDPITVIDIQRIVRDLAARGIGVLITDHNVRETLGICHRAYIVNEGEVMAAGTPETILADDRVRAVYLGDAFQL
ncbi:LPS export ABC transporter ATP-binding protein [Immundisolibacter sp.]|uniref:LPS export ABC transporter ATP-binding protein n=1 Tax=Immundisolibacter sp. TaxID=1934948 RepID=UPI0019C75731|nr:LPS export ABC transporter ATP-binding protein [Immundisolibacter sp.]MBC7161375.1 LPS export ABC transporter ATP-binding protein [Immundisolibacter sp.]MEA3220914.1 Lipopolysaccharide export system ATP-binding protein LptB [Immundisolibacter sp.]